MTSPDAYFEGESSEIVDEFLCRGLLEPDVERRVERLQAEDRPADALKVILACRRR